MAHLASLIETFKRSIYDLDFYAELSKRSFRFAFLYLYVLLAISTGIFLIKTTIFLFPKLPQVDSFVQKVRYSVKTSYPTDLVVTIKNGELQTNVSEPFYINFPQELNRKELGSYHIIAIDTSASLENFYRYRSMFLLTKNAVVTPDENNGFKVTPFQKNLNLRIDRDTYEIFVAKIEQYLNFVKPLVIYGGLLFLIIGPWIGAWIGMFGKIILVFFVSLLLFVLAKSVRANLRFASIYKMSLFGLTLSIIISTFQSLIPSPVDYMSGYWFGPVLGTIDMLYRNLPSLTYIVFMALVVLKFRQKSNGSENMNKS